MKSQAPSFIASTALSIEPCAVTTTTGTSTPSRLSVRRKFLRTLRREGVDVPVVVVTAHGSIESAVEAMKEGAWDFIPKPFDPGHLEIVVRKALDREDLRQGFAVLAEETQQRYRLI